MSAPPPLYDVIQIGYGPVSEIMALALARQGRSVAVFERWRERYPLPRAVCIDHELYRVLSSLGMSEMLPAVSHGCSWYRWYNADWKELLAIDWTSDSISGGPEVNFVHQPTLEKLFEDVVKTCPNVDVKLGWEALEASQTVDHVDVVVRDTESGEKRTVRGKYLIGTDGANSLVRKTIGSTQEDRGFEADWLVIDVLPHEGVELDIPPAAQWCNPVRPTTIVPAGLKDGHYFRRWEFMRLPHETREELEHEQVAWQLLEPWVKREQATMVRHKVYTFRSLLANSWRKGRMMIAGDAAHVMPPFMGQGMCAGLRDDWNLAWKLKLILDGNASDELLDTYQPERRPHVSDVVDLSMYLGKIICIADPLQAAERDEFFFSGKAPPPPPFPNLTDGILRRNAGGAVQPPAGLLSPHGLVRKDGHKGRFDDLAGMGFVLVSRNPTMESVLGQAQKAFLDALGAKRVVIAPEGTSVGSDALIDIDGKFVPFMQQHQVETMMIRPDFYLYGAVKNSHEVNQLVDDLHADLERHGVKLRNKSGEPQLP